MTPTRQVPQDVYSTPPIEPDRPSGDWPRRIESDVRAIKQDVREMKEALVGTLERRGFVRRVEDLEKAEQTRKRLVMGALLAAVGGVVTTLWNLLVHGKTSIP